MTMTFLIPAIIYLVSVLFLQPYLDFPFNDDWVYAKDVLMTVQNGRYTITGFEMAWGLPQVWFGVFLESLFGFSHGILRIFGILCTLVSGFTLWAYLKANSSQQWFIGLLLLSFFFFAPLYLVSVSFMTDVPFLMFWILTCYFWEKALLHKRAAFLWIGTLGCILCITQRQFGILIPFVGIIFLYFKDWKPRDKFQYYFAFGICLLVPIVVSIWWRTLENTWSPALGPRPNPVRIVRDLHSTWLYFGFALLPAAVLLFQHSRLSSYLQKVLIFLAIVTLGRGLFSDQWMPYIGNVISEFGVFRLNEVLQGVRPENFSIFGKVGLTLLSFFGAFTLLTACGPIHFRTLFLKVKSEKFLFLKRAVNQARFGYFTAAMGVVYLAAILFRAGIFDRYLLPAFVSVLILLSYSAVLEDSFRKWTSIFAAVIVTAFSFSTHYDYFRWAEARLHVAQDMVRSGIAPQEIHAGYEWNGFHGKNSHPPTRVDDIKYVVSFSEMPGFEVVSKKNYRSLWPPFERTIFGLKNQKFN